MVRLSGETSDGVRATRRARGRWRRPGMGLALLLIPLSMGNPATGGEKPRSPNAQLKLGEELFNREWTPNDPRCHGGDGLGPVYNESSCVACHGQGGPGGAGPSGMNVQLLSAVGSEISGFGINSREIRIEAGPLAPDLTPILWPLSGVGEANNVLFAHLSTAEARGWFRDGLVFSANGKVLTAHEFDLQMYRDGRDSVLTCAAGSITARSFTLKPDPNALREIHPGLVAAPSVVIHHFGVDPRYEAWRSRLMKARFSAPGARSDRWHIVRGGILGSQRNSPPIFGLGLIDDLPDEVLVAAAEQEPPQIRGHVSRMKSGRIGRFGWKAQTADLREFVLGACAGELGLEVPGHPQATSPLAPDQKAPAPDLTPEEGDALVAYVKALPAPIRLGSPHSESIEAGRQAFEEVGCADCHRPSLGSISGIYSDLLLHDMGPDLVSVVVQVYYGPPEKLDVPTAASMADGTEWRTPPLWGYRDSGPYLHDGRAKTLVEAVKAHKGQARDSAACFFRLSQSRQSLIEQFLKSMAAPTPVEPTVIADAKRSSERRGSLVGPPANPSPARRRAVSPQAEAAARAEQVRIAASRLKLAKSLEKMNKPQGALVFYREILRDEPGTDAARIAALRIKTLGGEATVRQAP